MKKNVLQLVIACMLLSSATVIAGTIDSGLDLVFESTPIGETVSALVFLNEQVDLNAITEEMDAQRATLQERHEVVVRSLQDVADRTQSPIVEYLDDMLAEGKIEGYHAFYIANCFRVDATRGELEKIASRDDVFKVYFNYEIELIEPVEIKPDPGGDITAETGVEEIRAPECWAMGVDGSGVLVANMDTGVDGSHSALASRWAGVADSRYSGHPEWAWYDPYNNQNDFPYDNGGHGTHTMGTVCGGAPGDAVGVAPGALWIASAPIDRGGGIEGTMSDAMLSFEWMLDPDNNPSTNWDVPDVCSNSWGVTTSHGYPPCDDTLWSYLDACEAAGTIIVFSAGNEGSSGLRRPSDRATDDYRTFAVAAVDAGSSGWPIASFSSRGPTYCTPGGGAAIKPDISAPGVDVRSSYPGGGYTSMSGTSMASPHINGVIALMRQVNPSISVNEIKQIIFDTAVDLGSSGEDNDYGWGMVDAYEAVMMAMDEFVSFSYPEGLPTNVDPNGGTNFLVQVSMDGVEGTGMFHYDYGTGYSHIDMQLVGSNLYRATFPAIPCGSTVNFYMSAEDAGSQVWTDPSGAPSSSYSAISALGYIVSFEDNFETNQGWTAENLGATSGDWQRGIPVNDSGWDYDPSSDGDGSGQCYLTQNETGNTDVDEGAVRLTSPVFDMAGGGTIDYDYYLYLTDTDGSDMLLVEMDDNGGSGPWAEVDRHDTNGGTSWRSNELTETDITSAGLSLTSTMCIRFTANDADAQSIVEAGIDGFTVSSIDCGGPLPDVSIDMIPDSYPVYTTQGGSFDFTGKLFNNTALQQYTDVWIMLVLPNSNWYGPIRQWNNIPLAPNDSLVDPNASQYIPVYAMVGDYYYYAFCGDYPSTKLDSASFDFLIFPGLGRGATDWNIEGWFGDSEGTLPLVTELHGNFPNPFNATTTVSYSLSADGDVNLEVYNLMGQKVETLFSGRQTAGFKTIQWDASSYSSGVYFYKLSAGEQTFTKRMTLLK
ncbi:MAG: S8 family serine peptidase [candidate division Zixibacteria bacterium]|nr:S8 family serine peptidase [candidate division Zixibacteria bacterium]